MYKIPANAIHYALEDSFIDGGNTLIRAVDGKVYMSFSTIRINPAPIHVNWVITGIGFQGAGHRSDISQINRKMQSRKDWGKSKYSQKKMQYKTVNYNSESRL